MQFKILTQLQLSLSTVITFLTQHLGLSIFDPNLGWNNPALTHAKTFKKAFFGQIILSIPYPRLVLVFSHI